jgi:hypothetical protein
VETIQLSDLPVLLNESTGVLTLTGLPLSSLAIYHSTLPIKCSSPTAVGDATARTVVQINWHPAPQFDPVKQPIQIAKTAAIGDVLWTLHLKDRFPYQIQYVLKDHSSFLGVEASTGQVILTATLPANLERSFSVIISAFEPDRVGAIPNIRTEMSFLVEINDISSPGNSPWKTRSNFPIFC